MSTPSPEMRGHIAALITVLNAVAKGEEPADDPADVFDQALGFAMASAGHDPWRLSTTLPEVVASNVRRLRNEAGLRQEELADLMVKLGFAWSRTTVSDAERRVDPDEEPPRLPRRLSQEELFALAILFGVPIAELWQVPPGLVVDFSVPGLNDIGAAQVAELIVGRHGAIGQGGPTWAAAAAAVAPGVEIERPARRLWRTRRANEKKGGK